MPSQQLLQQQQDYAEAILKAAGVMIDCSTSSSPLIQLENWLGIQQQQSQSPPQTVTNTIGPIMMTGVQGGGGWGNHDNTTTTLFYEGLTVEDCLPLDPSVYHILSEWIIREWTTSASAVVSSSSSLVPEQPLPLRSMVTKTDDQEDDHIRQMQQSSTATTKTTTTTTTPALPTISLEDLIPSVRVTRYLRHWMDLTLEDYDNPNDRIDNDNNERGGDESKRRVSLSHKLLRLGESPKPQLQQQVSNASASTTTTTTSSSRPTRPFPLLHALYQHIQELPILQAHMHRYIHSLQQQQQQQQFSPGAGASASSTTLLRDPKTRLEQYARVQALGQQLSDQWQAHVDRLEYLCGSFYRASGSSGRRYARRGLGRVWATYLLDSTSTTSTTGGGVRQENTRAAGIRLTLRVLYRILQGIQQTQNDYGNNNNMICSSSSSSNNNHQPATVLHPCYVDLLFTLLVPLHKPDAMVLWRDQMCCLELYHEPLTQCCATLLQRQPNLLPKFICALLDKEIFPVMTGNTPKQVLLLHEMDLYLKLLLKHPSFCAAVYASEGSSLTPTTTIAAAGGSSLSWTNQLLTALARCMSSDNSRLAERALDFFRNPAFEGFVTGSFQHNNNNSTAAKEQQFTASLHILLPALLRRSWNPTVRKRTYHVLELLQQYDPTIFERVCNQIGADGPAAAATKPPAAVEKEKDDTDNNNNNNKNKSSSLERSAPTAPVVPTDFSLKAGMGSWKPPPRQDHHHHHHHNNDDSAAAAEVATSPSSSMPPPLSIPRHHHENQQHQQSPGRQSTPPLTVTGVAPWATGVGAHAPPPRRSFPQTASGTTAAAPPLTVTGVAPWAVSSASKKGTTAPFGRGGVLPSIPSHSGVQQQPPLTITGVAPWANSSTSLPPTVRPKPNPNVIGKGSAPWSTSSAGATAGPAPVGRKRSAPQHPPQHPLGNLSAATTSTVSYLEETVEEDDEEDIEEDSLSPSALPETPPAPATGYSYVQAFMESIKPPPEETGASSWSKAQMAETPTLLPQLKFHDLVFGHDLGSGAFGCVRYARLIDRTKTRSMWPEYAVKVISTAKIKELGYEASVQREIAVLHVLSHPGIARLVSSFRFHEGAYLVLEYASGGDLHHLLRKNGSLDHDSTRFVMGEVVAALASIHDAGLVYADLKTENILITETGHIKLTDFGGCRPIALESKERIRSISKDILKNLRDGGWKPQKKKNNETSGGGGGDGESEDDILDEDEEEDHRIEGTTSYLPPEVVMGGLPTFAADAWALGCVTYQCLTGRPPFLEDDDEATRHRIVKFNTEQSGPTGQIDRLFEEKHAVDVSTNARDMIKSLLQRDPGNRPDLHKVAQSPFFVEADVDVFSLYSKDAYPLDVGTVGPTPDAKWSRRQFSSIWAPQPQAYDLSVPGDNAKKNSLDCNSSTLPILEGDEATGFFSPSSGDAQKKLGQISEQQQRLPPRSSTSAASASIARLPPPQEEE